MSLETFPLVLLLAYLGLSILLFAAGPIPWPVNNMDAVLLYLAIVVTLLICGFTIGAFGSANHAPMRHWKALFLVGALAACGILFPSAYVYTGKMPWQILEALRDQNQVYRDMLDRLVETDGTRGPIAILRAIGYPAVFAVIPLGVLHWSRLSWLFRGLLFASIASSVMFSILRGTDRETFDSMIIVGAASLVAIGRHCSARQISLLRFLFTGRMLAIVVAGGLVALLAFNLFVDRKASRYEGDVSGVCVGIEDICADRRHPIMQELSLRNQFGFAMMSAYIAQGYYGLALAMDIDFHSTFGTAHSPLVSRIYSALSGDERLYEQSYTYRIRDYGWSDENQWSTLIVWFANDVGFAGAAVVICVLAFLLGRAWKDAVFARNDYAAVVFCLLMQLFIYLPANNQIMQTLDGYLALFVWLLLWLWPRRSNGTFAI